MRRLLRRLAWISADRRAVAQVAVLNQLARCGEMHGGVLATATRLSYGRLYTALAELENRGLITSRWDNTGPYPRHRLYQLSDSRRDDSA